MRNRFLKAKHWLLMALMGLSGFSMSSCSDRPYEPEEDMYGCPETEFDDPVVNE